MSSSPPYDEKPPSYQSLFGQLKDAKAQSDGNVSFARTACGIVAGSIACTICLAILLAIPITNIVMGAVYLDDCPAERYIPIYLIVVGVVAIIQDVFSIIKKHKGRNTDETSEEDQKPSTLTNIFSGCIGLFLFIWFILGNVWIFSTADDWTSNPNSNNYCNPTLYYYAFWSTLVTYILIGAACCCAIFGCCCVMCIAGAKSSS